MAAGRTCAIACAGLMLAACASLPNSRQERAASPVEPVEFEGAHGTVSAAKSDAILQGIQGNSAASDVLQKHLAYEQAINPANPLVLGNKLTVLQNGPATYAAMFADIRAARHHINLETYIFDDDVSGGKFSDLLLERQAAGVQVHVMYDSVGGLMTPAAFFDRLRAGGIKVLEFNPVNPMAGNKSWRLNNRDHRRQLVIDGRIAYTGGVNISDTYSSGPGRRRPTSPAEGQLLGWRDTHIRIEGPVVAEFQKLYLQSWARQKGEPMPALNWFPKLEPRGDEIVRAIGSTPTDPASLIFLTLMSAISHAELSVHLTIAYFSPDPQLLKALTDAVARGVNVKLLLPANSDSWAIFNLGRSYYTALLKGGVRIFERRGAVMHAKTACIDRVWSTIGSTNLDSRSFLHNDEINAVVLGRAFAGQMEEMFAADLKQSDEIVLERWKHRAWSSRIKEWTARIGVYWL